MSMRYRASLGSGGSPADSHDLEQNPRYNPKCPFAGSIERLGSALQFSFRDCGRSEHVPRRQEAANLFARTNVAIPIIRKQLFCVKSLFTTCGKPLVSPSASHILAQLAPGRFVTTSSLRSTSVKNWLTFMVRAQSKARAYMHRNELAAFWRSYCTI